MAVLAPIEDAVATIARGGFAIVVVRACGAACARARTHHRAGNLVDARSAPLTARSSLTAGELGDARTCPPHHPPRPAPTRVQDDADRENEGDFIGAGARATAAAVALMLRFCTGVVCAALPQARCAALELPPMVPARSGDPFRTAFTLTVDAVRGTSTGISAGDRAATLRALAAPGAAPGDLSRPGHVFPLAARDGGVLVRGGHTEATVDLARLAGCDPPVGFLCEVCDTDSAASLLAAAAAAAAAAGGVGGNGGGGTLPPPPLAPGSYEMLRLPALATLAGALGMPLVSIADLQRFRLRREALLVTAAAAALDADAADAAGAAAATVAADAADGASSSGGAGAGSHPRRRRQRHHFASVFSDTRYVVTVVGRRRRSAAAPQPGAVAGHAGGAAADVISSSLGAAAAHPPPPPPLLRVRVASASEEPDEGQDALDDSECEEEAAAAAGEGAAASASSTADVVVVSVVVRGNVCDNAVASAAALHAAGAASSPVGASSSPAPAAPPPSAYDELYPAPPGVVVVADARQQLLRVCDRARAELAQAVRAALRAADAAPAAAGGGTVAPQPLPVYPPHELVDGGACARPERELAADPRCGRAAWPAVAMHPSPDVAHWELWKWGLRVELLGLPAAVAHAPTGL